MTATSTLPANILAIDPGDTTGWVLVSFVPPSAVEILLHGTFSADNLAEEYSHARTTYPLADLVVMENYVIYPEAHILKANIGSKLTAVKVIGRAEGHFYIWNESQEQAHPAFQTASQAKQQWTNSRLRRHFPRPDFDLRPSGKPGVCAEALCAHECDALRHALTFIENHFGVALVLTDKENVL